MPRAKLTINGDNIYTEKVKRVQKLTQETENKIDNIPGVVDALDSISTTDALSAAQGKILQDQINELKSMWRFLSTWDCTTGLPTTDPVDDPYDYRIWDYYIVSAVGSWTNYRPYWDTYIAWVASTTVETDIVKVNDWYLYDWQHWILQKQNQIVINVDTALSTTSTNAVENRVITNAINTKQNTITDLNTIRSNALLWASALQPWDNISELTNDLWYQTAWDVVSAISGIVLPTVNNKTITIQKNGTAVDSFTLNQATDKSINIAVPTKTSDLTNDSGYATTSSIPTKTSDLTNDSGFITSANVPSKTSDLTNDSGFITSSYIGNGQITVKQWAANKWSFTLNQAWAATITLERTQIISQAEYNQLAVKDPNTTYLITDGTPASQAGFINYPTSEEVQQAINTAIAGLVSDAALSPSWDWVTSVAPSKNATYDALGDVETLLANL